jgi:hypothetical protein
MIKEGKMRTLKRNLLAILVVCVIVISPPLAFAISTVSIQPPVSTVDVGSLLDVIVDISSVTDLYAFQFDIGFDPAVLSAIDVTEGPFLPSGGSTFFLPGTIDNIGGSISFTADSLIGAIPGVSGDGTLATLSFQALALGTSPVDLSNVILLDSSFADISYNTAGASVNVVPEPGTLILLGSGLLSALALKKRFKKSRI